MYSNLYQINNKYALMEASLKSIYGIDADTVNSIIALHQTVYKPQFESVGSVARISLAAVLTGTALYSGAAGVIASAIAVVSAISGGTAIPFIGAAAAVLFAGWAVYDAVTDVSKAKKEVKEIIHEGKAMDVAKAAVKEQMTSNPYAKYAVNAAKRTGQILKETGGTLMDKLDAVSKTTTTKKADSTDTINDDEFAKKFGFTKDLQIVDEDNALNHSMQFFYYMNGFNEYGNKVIDKEAHDEFMKQFEEYWEEHRDFLPYLNEKAARSKMFVEFGRKYYKETFMPMFKKKLAEAKKIKDKGKSAEELEAEGRNEFGDVVDNAKYYATMGFTPDAEITDINKFSKAFTAKTGLDLSYNPVSPEGEELLERMMKDKSEEYLKYLPAPVFLMEEKDQKPFIEKARDPKRRGESQVGRYGKDMIASNAAAGTVATEQKSGNGAVARNGAAQQQPQQKQQQQTASSNQQQDDITNAPDVDKQSGPWRTVGKAQLLKIYNLSPDRSKHLMRLGYIMNIKNGKFYRMSDADRLVMPQIVHEARKEAERKWIEQRRQIKLNQGRLTRDDMTKEEIEESNRRAGFPSNS